MYIVARCSSFMSYSFSASTSTRGAFISPVLIIRQPSCNDDVTGGGVQSKREELYLNSIPKIGHQLYRFLTIELQSQYDGWMSRICLLFKIVTEDMSYPNPPFRRKYRCRNTLQFTSPWSTVLRVFSADHVTTSHTKVVMRHLTLNSIMHAHLTVL